jgi:hypothetical protein
MVHYAVTVDGKVIGSRSSKSHAQPIYTHAVINRFANGDGVDGVISYHSSEQLARDAARAWGNNGFNKLRGGLYVVPVAVTARRAKVGDVVVAQGVL